MLFDHMFDGVQTRSEIIKQGAQTAKCFITKQCLMIFGSQTFPVWPGLHTQIKGIDTSTTLCAHSIWHAKIFNSKCCHHLILVPSICIAFRPLQITFSFSRLGNDYFNYVI